MSSKSNELGERIHHILLAANLETPYTQPWPEPRVSDFENKFAEILSMLGMDMSDDSLRETPMRVAKMYIEEVFYGLNYANFPKCTTVRNRMGYKEMVLVKDIEVKSMCEHHLVPFIGKCHIAYIPDGEVLGLSKFNRVVDFFSRRPQIQERLTEQVSLALSTILGTEDIAVVVEADHMCVRLRGVQDPCSSTITSRVRGKFFTVPTLRGEFLELIRRK